MSVKQSDNEQQQNQIYLSNQRFDPFPPGFVLPPLPEPSNPIPPIALPHNCQSFKIKSNPKKIHPEPKPEHRLHPLIVCILDPLFTFYYWIRRLFPYKTPSRYRRPAHLRAQPSEIQEAGEAVDIEKRGNISSCEEVTEEAEIENDANNKRLFVQNVKGRLRIEQWRNDVEEETKKQRRAVEVDVEGRL